MTGDDDEIMSELRQIREKMLSEWGSDPDTRFLRMKEIEAEEARKGRRIASLPARPAGKSILHVPDQEPGAVPR